MAAQYVDWEHLRAYSEGDRTFEEQVIAAFFQQMHTQFADLEQALIREDFATLAKGIHQLRGAAGNLGTYPLYELLVKCDQAVAQFNIHDCWYLFREAKQVLVKTIAECNHMGFYGNEVH
jgi:HPt (histidine-containing phosphotransfer) domain-containing protein